MTHLYRELSRLFLAIAVLAATFTAQESPRTAQRCECPTFVVEANLDVVKAGDTVEFAVAQFDFKTPNTPVGTFEWTISRGTIVSGQGTAKIVVQTSGDMLTAPTATPSPLPDSGEHGYIISVWGPPSRGRHHCYCKVRRSRQLLVRRSFD